jgi:hypothetical protein
MFEQSNAVDFSVFEQLDVRVGRITGVEVAEGCRVSAYKLELDFGSEIGSDAASRRQPTIHRKP